MATMRSGFAAAQELTGSVAENNRQIRYSQGEVGSERIWSCKEFDTRRFVTY